MSSKSMTPKYSGTPVAVPLAQVIGEYAFADYAEAVEAIACRA